MLKEFKANYYRLFRSKTFYIIFGLLFLGACLCCFLIKFMVDDPFGAVNAIREAISEISETNPSDAIYLDVYSSSLDTFQQFGDVTGIVRIQMIGGIGFMLYSLLVVLFVGREFKSRFYVNHYSGNSSPVRIAFVQWLSMICITFFMQVVLFLFTAGVTFACCNNVRMGDLSLAFRYFLMAVLGNAAFVTFGYMVTFIRKSFVMATVLTCLYTLGFIDLLVAFASIFIKPLRLLALSSQVELTIDDFSALSYASTICSMLFFILLYLGITLVVAKRRDAY